MKSSILLALISISFIAHAQNLSSKEMKDLKGSIAEGCYAPQRASQVNSIASDAQIRYYCSCYAEELVLPNTTIQDFKEAINVMQRSGGEAMIKVFLKGRSLYSIANSCSEKAFKYAK